MRSIVPDVLMVEGLRGGQVYALAVGEGVALIDTGVSGAAGQILDQLEASGFAPSDLRAILLTHAHGDHIGSAAELARRSGALVLAHRDEVPYVEGSRSLPAASWFQRLLLWMQRRLLGGTAECKVDRALEDGEVLEAWGGLRVIHTPGHTPGSICLYWPGRKVLFCGDLLFNGHPLTGRGGLRFSIPQFSADAAQARISVRKLLEFPVEVLCFGHGEPILEGAERSIRELLSASA